MLLLTGCVEPPQMFAPMGMNQQEADRDSAGCRNQAQVISQPAHSWVRDKVYANAYRDCLIERGHTAAR